MFAMDASTEGPVVAHGQNQDFMLCLCYVHHMDLLHMEIVIILLLSYVYVMTGKQILGVTLLLNSINMYQ